MRWGFAWLIGLVLIASCKTADDSPEVGSNSNWLRACDAPVDCSAANIPECACGVCTLGCMSDQDCDRIEDARCALEASTAARSACGETVSGGICLPRCEPGGCGEGQACANGACVLAALPDTEFCDALPASTEEARARQDELLALAEAQRTDAGFVCLGQPMSLPQPTLRLSPSLVCAARALAIEIERTRALSVTDSEGRDTQARLALAGYEPLLWADAFALEAASPQHALELMLQDIANCMRISDGDFIDIGIGVAGDAYVMTLAAP
jgi:hypothetical protein